jgi:hypothetical protein
MSRNKFIKTIEDFCAACGLEDPERILHGGPIAVDEVVFSLIHSENIDPDLLFVYSEFGDLPAGREAQACRALLEANLLLYTGKGPAFTVSPETGRVVFAEHFRLDEISGEQLRDALTRTADQAKKWRGNHFLDNAPPAPRPSARPGASALRRFGGGAPGGGNV